MKEEKQESRRGFLKASGGAIIAAGSIGLFEASAQHHEKVAFSAANDPLGSATVSFGGWVAGFGGSLDRFVNPRPAILANHHEIIPRVARIRAGGYVNFLISGLHVLAIYDDGAKPEDIDTSLVIPRVPPIINDPNRRIYRGIDPVTTPGPPPPIYIPDRIEVVYFHAPGTYLVICAVLPHFNEGMYGYVKVRSGGDRSAEE